MDARTDVHFVWCGPSEKVTKDPTLFVGPNSLSERQSPDANIELWLPAAEIPQLERVLTHPERVHINRIEDLWKDPDLTACFSKDSIYTLKEFYKLLATGEYPAYIVQKVFISLIIMAAKGGFYFDTTFNFEPADLLFLRDTPNHLVFPMQEDTRDLHERIEHPLLEVFMFFSPTKKNEILKDIVKRYFVALTSNYNFDSVRPILNYPNTNEDRLQWMSNHITTIALTLFDYAKQIEATEENLDKFLKDHAWIFNMYGSLIIFQKYNLQKQYRNAWRNDFEKIQELFKDLSKEEIEHHPTAYILDKETGATIAHEAARQGKIHFLQFLAEKGFVLDQIRDQLGNTIAHSAASNGEIEVLLLLPEALLNQANSKHETVAHHLVMYGYLLALQILAERIDFTKQDDTGVTPLCLAAQLNKFDIAKFLIERVPTANLNIKNTYGNAPIHFFADSGNLEGIKLLAERGADLNLADNRGVTALYLAAKNNNLEMCQYLLDRGADPTQTTHKGYTALNYAEYYGFSEISELLKSRMRHGPR